MATNNAVNLETTNNADGFSVAGGTTKRALTVTGGDVELNGGGSGAITFPAGPETLVGRASVDTLTNKTLTSPVLTTPQINDTSADHQYIVAVSELTADRTVTLPLLAGNDEFVFKDHAQTLTNKTLTTPIISGAISFPDNVRQTFNPGANAAGLNVGSHTADPDTPINGDVWYQSTANELRARINGATVALGAGGGGGANTALSNLASVAINTSLISDTNNTDDLGSSSISWKDLYLAGAANIGAGGINGPAGSALVLNAGVNGGIRLSRQGTIFWEIPWNGTEFYPNSDNAYDLGRSTERVRDLYMGRNILIGGTAVGTSGAGVVLITNGTAPTTSPANSIQLYAEDVSTSSELKVRDEAGNITVLSPHNFSQIPDGPSEEMAWAFYSERDGKYINVDMLKLARWVEKLTGDKLVHTGTR